jgi:phosphatidylserine/phosphatidylglycerophosphate/cardiolipin synthase-like enzyme
MKLINSHAVLEIINVVMRAPHNYQKLIVCSPFVKEELLSLLKGLQGKIPLSVQIYTLPETYKTLISNDKSNIKNLTIKAIPHLHAKAYIAYGKVDRDSIALVGSFNFTEAAIKRNFEVGIILSSIIPEEGIIIKKLIQKLNNIASYGKEGVIKHDIN